MNKEIDKDDARQGETGQGVRYMLFGSLALAVVALGLLWIFIS